MQLWQTILAKAVALFIPSVTSIPTINFSSPKLLQTEKIVFSSPDISKYPTSGSNTTNWES